MVHWVVLFGIPELTIELLLQFKNTYWIVNGLSVEDGTSLSHTHTHAHMGAQWLSGRVLDSRPKGRGFEPHRRHCVVVLEQNTFILA